MKWIVDTHAFLWFVAGQDRLGPDALKIMAANDSELYLSAGSVWEMAIKVSLGRLQLQDPFETFLTERMEEGVRWLPVELKHLFSVASLPFHHRDPFDRLIIAQALCEELPILTRDPIFKAYGVHTVW